MLRRQGSAAHCPLGGAVHESATLHAGRVLMKSRGRASLVPFQKGGERAENNAQPGAARDRVLVL